MSILEGDVLDLAPYDARDTQIEKLRAENRELERQLSDAKVEAERAREDANRALSMLRKQLGPLYRALQAVFGELDAAGVMDETPQRPAAATASDAGPAMDTRVKAVWDSWKSRLPPACGKVIDALLLHGELNNAQLKVAAGLGGSTVSDAIYKLKKAGLINKNGGRFSLKQL